MIPKDSLTKSQWECVHFDKASQEHKTLLNGLLDLGYFVSSIDARKIDSEKGLLDAVSQAMRFPGYFGKNWDALDECLRDMAWLPADMC